MLSGQIGSHHATNKLTEVFSHQEAVTKEVLALRLSDGQFENLQLRRHCAAIKPLFQLADYLLGIN